jgi:hypothetical protein
MIRRHWALAATVLLLGGCSADEVIGTASRTVRNICANAPNCTVYDEAGEPDKDPGPWDTKLGAVTR